MIVTSQDLISKLEHISGDTSCILNLAEKFINDQTPEEDETKILIDFPSDKTNIKEYNIFFRLDPSTDSLSIALIKDIDKEPSIKNDINCIYSNFYETIRQLAN